MLKRAVLILCAILMIAVFGLTPAAANGQSLPPLPPQPIINSVLAQTNGAIYTPLGVPQTILTQLGGFGGAFTGAQNWFNVSQSVSYFDTNGRLRELIMPLQNSRYEILDPVFTAPGSNPRPAKVIGAVFQPSRGLMIAVAIFKPEAFGCPNCEPPEKIRFYYTNTQYHEYSLYWGQFVDYYNDGVVELVDEGAVIAHKISCLNVGLEQVCWDPYDYSQVRQEPQPKDIVYNAYTILKDVYDLGVDFYVDDAVPDILGGAQRAGCWAQYRTATSFNALSSCIANVVFSASKDAVSGQPIAVMVVLSSADVRTYRADGSFVGALPPGQYLVMDATPHITTPGAASLLYLVNADGVNHYLIPSNVVQGFGENPAFDERYAGVRDGLAGRRSFGF